MIGETVSHYKEPGKVRCCCLFGEVANLASELHGCIAIGMVLGFHAGSHAVLDSADANRQLNRFVNRDTHHELMISERFGGWD
jgi:hypothetical protein